MAAVVVAVVAVLLILALGTEKKRDENVSNVQANAAATEDYELEVLAGKHKELPVYSVARDDKKIALTIDAAWEDDKTPFILEELDRQGIKATFYLCGVWVDAYPEHVKEILSRGHELGNHSQTHPHMNKLTADGIANELTTLDDHIEKITGVRTTTFRAPFGEYNDLVVTTSRALGYEVVQWSIDTVTEKE